MNSMHLITDLGVFSLLHRPVIEASILTVSLWAEHLGDGTVVLHATADPGSLTVGWALIRQSPNPRCKNYKACYM